MRSSPYDLGFSIFPDTSRASNVCQFPIQGGYESNPKQAELLLRDEIFSSKKEELGRNPSFKIKCAVCLLTDEPNGFVGIVSNQKSVVDFARNRARLESQMEETWHHDHAVDSCVVSAVELSEMVKAKTREQCRQAEENLKESLKSQCDGETSVLEGSIRIGHHLQTMLHLVMGDDDADYWYVMVQKDDKDDESITLDLPGGKRRLGETSLECAIRETREETSLLVDPSWIVSVLQHKDEPGNNYFRMKPPAELLDDTTTERLTQAMTQLKVDAEVSGVVKTKEAEAVKL